jgi:hypothetical protein
VRTAGVLNDLAVVEGSGTFSLGLGGLAYATGGGLDESAQVLGYTVAAVPAASLGDVVLADGITVVNAGTSYTLAEVQGMQFRATSNGNGGPDLFSFVVSDDGGTAAGGVDALTQALRITVTPANAAPLLFGSNSLAGATEDIADTGTPVSQLIAGQVGDSDPGALGGIAVTAVDNSNGSWQYTTDGGTTWTAFGAVTENAARLLAADGQTSVRFVANPDWNGTVVAGLTFRAWDQTRGTSGLTVADAGVNGGSSAFSTGRESVDIVVTAINDAPERTGGVLADLSVNAGSGTTSLGLAGLSFAPGPATAIDEASQLLSYTVTAVPPPGIGDVVLSDGATVVSAGSGHTLAELRGVQFRAATGASGGQAVFSFVVADDGVGPGVGTTSASLIIRVAAAPPPAPAPDVQPPAPPPAPAPAIEVAPQAPPPAPRPESEVVLVLPSGGELPPQPAPVVERSGFAEVEATRVVVAPATFQRRGGDATEAAQPEMLLASFTGQARAGTSGVDDFQRVLRSSAFEAELDRMREDVRKEFDLDRTTSISAAGVTLGASVIYVLWLIRGGVLMSSYLSALPAWRVLDPLPVLSRVDDDYDAEDDDLDALAGDDAEPATTLRGF